MISVLMLVLQTMSSIKLVVKKSRRWMQAYFLSVLLGFLMSLLPLSTPIPSNTPAPGRRERLLRGEVWLSLATSHCLGSSSSSGQVQSLFQEISSFSPKCSHSNQEQQGEQQLPSSFKNHCPSLGSGVYALLEFPEVNCLQLAKITALSEQRECSCGPSKAISHLGLKQKHVYIT